MIVYEDGGITGTIGGGLAEARVTERAEAMLAANKKGPVRPALMYVDMSGNQIKEGDMICGGAIVVLLEVV
jgi:xanthine/CO dehydrogenase XdhC/CoxF family maturation factor